MKLGFDLDDVVVNTIPSIVNFYNNRYGGCYMPKDIVSFNLWEVGIGRDREEAIQIVDEFFGLDDSEEMPLIEGSVESLHKLHSEGNKINIVTSRPLRFRVKTNRFLNRHLRKIPYEIFYSGDFHKQEQTKAEICSRIGIDLMVEDCLQYALKFRDIKVCLLDKPWNQDGDLPENLVRVYNWNEILKEIEKLRRKK